MSEGTPGNLDYNQKLDLVLKRAKSIPTDLIEHGRDYWTERIDAALTEDELEQINGEIDTLETARLAAGRKTILESDHLKEHPEIAARVLQTVESVREYKKHPEYIIGKGQVAFVYSDPDLREMCAKLVYNMDKYRAIGANTVGTETEYLDRLRNLNVDGARTPFPYAYIRDAGLYGIVMERLNAISVGDLIHGTGTLPALEDFSYTTFAKKLKNYFSAMHDMGIYHGDFHAGNVMIDYETHDPRIIDFGIARDHYLDADKDKAQIIDIADIGKITQLLKKFTEEKRG